VKAYLKQQAGYGKAEALLTSRHSSRFGQFGGARWNGVVYQTALRRLSHHASRIYSGVFGSASYQSIYGAPVSELGWILTGFAWWLLTLTVALNALWLHGLIWLAAAMAAVPLLHTLLQALRLPLPARWRGGRARLLLWFLLLMQPLVRGWTRFLWNVRLGSSPGGPWMGRSESPPARRCLYKRVASLELWSENGQDRRHLLDALTVSLRAAGSPVEADDGWRDWDLETSTGRWWRVRFSSVTEYHGDNQCLTRVRIASRATLLTVFICTILPIIAIILVFLAGWHPVWVLGTLFTGTVLFETLHRAAINRAANRVVTAGAGAGFLVADKGAAAPEGSAPTL
jgi:hypothetical protein